MTPSAAPAKGRPERAGAAPFSQPTTREEWLEARTRGIGSSDGLVAAGMSPWKSPLRLWGEKTRRIEPADLAGVEAVEWGHRLEDAIARKWSEENAERDGRELAVRDPGDFHIERPRGSVLFCTVDRFIHSSDYGLRAGVLELKTAGVRSATEWEHGAPLYYQAQLQHQLHCTGLAWGSIAVLIGGQSYKSFEYTRNDRFLDWYVAKLTEFWGWVQADEWPPDVDGSEDSTAALRDLLPQHVEEKVVELPGDMIQWADQWDTSKSALAGWDLQRRQAENKIKRAIGDGEVGVLPDGSAFSWKTASDGTRRFLRRHAE